MVQLHKVHSYATNNRIDCCKKVAEAEERLEGTNSCIASLEAFQTVYLEKDVLYTSLVSMHAARGDEVKLPIGNR